MPVDDPQPGELWIYQYAAGCDEECCSDRIILNRFDHIVEVQRVGHMTRRIIADPYRVGCPIIRDDYRFREVVTPQKRAKSGFSQFVSRIECSEVKDV